MNEAKEPTETLKALVPSQDREQRMADVIGNHYASVLSLGDNASQSMLEDLFAQEYGVQGSTRRKSIAFFLAAAKYSEIPVSKFFKTPKRPPSTGASKRSSKGKNEETNNEDPLKPPPLAPPGTAKDRYIDLLLQKAESEMDPDLLNRIERVIGIEASEGEIEEVDTD